MGYYREDVVCYGYSWNLNRLCKFELHIYGEKQMVFWPANFIFSSQVVISGIRKMIALIERELAEGVFPSDHNMGEWNKAQL